MRNYAINKRKKDRKKAEKLVHQRNLDLFISRKKQALALYIQEDNERKIREEFLSNGIKPLTHLSRF